MVISCYLATKLNAAWTSVETVIQCTILKFRERQIEVRYLWLCRNIGDILLHTFQWKL